MNWLVTVEAIFGLAQGQNPWGVLAAGVTGIVSLVAIVVSVWNTQQRHAFEEQQAQQRHAFEEQQAQRQQDFEHRQAQHAELLKPQLEAFRKLWSLMIVASPALVPPLTEGQNNIPQTSSWKWKLLSWKRKDLEFSLAKRHKLENELRQWYYENGNGLFLSNEARDLLVYAEGELKDDKVTRDEVVLTLSLLRTQTKNDVGVYGKWRPFKLTSLIPTIPFGQDISAEGLALLRQGPSISSEPELRVKMKAKVLTRTIFRVYLNNTSIDPPIDITIESCQEKAVTHRHSSSAWRVLSNPLSESDLKTIEIKYVHGDKAGRTVLQYRSE